MDSSLVKANVSSHGLAPSGMTVEEFREQAIQVNGLFLIPETTVDDDGVENEETRYFQNPEGKLPLNPVDTDARWNTSRAGKASGLQCQENVIVNLGGSSCPEGSPTPLKGTRKRFPICLTDCRWPWCSQSWRAGMDFTICAARPQPFSEACRTSPAASSSLAWRSNWPLDMSSMSWVSSIPTSPSIPAKTGGGRLRGNHLVARVRPTWRISEVNMVVDEFTQTQVLGERGRKEQPSIVDQAVVIEGDVDVVGVVASMEWSRSGGGLVFPKPLSPKHRRTLLTPWHAATLSSRWIGAYQRK